MPDSDEQLVSLRHEASAMAMPSRQQHTALPCRDQVRIILHASVLVSAVQQSELYIPLLRDFFSHLCLRRRLQRARISPEHNRSNHWSNRCDQSDTFQLSQIWCTY